VKGYGQASYGDGMADVYDDWYGDTFDTGAAIDALQRLAGDGPVLELGAGTGRLAVPLARAGLEVHALDASRAMLAQLAAKSGGDQVHCHLGDMATDLPAGPFTLTFVAVNTFFNVTEEARQREVFRSVASRLAPGGRFVIEAFVPDLDRDGDYVELRDVAVDKLVLSVSRSNVASQRAEGHFIEFVTGATVQLRPWSIRWATVAQLDEMAAAAGFDVDQRWSGWSGEPFGPQSDNHVTIYRVV